MSDETEVSKADYIARFIFAFVVFVTVAYLACN